MDVKMSIGIRIQRERIRRGLSQETLAEMLGVSRQSVSKWEIGQTMPDIDKIILLSQKWEMSTDDLLIEQPKESLDAVSEEAVRFIYKHYFLDEFAYGKDVLIYCQGDRMIFSVCSFDDYFEFCLIFNENEFKNLESHRDEFPSNILETYTPKWHGDTGWRVSVPVTNLETWEYVKKLMLIKMKPNRTPFPEEGLKKSVNGTRCDRCVHYLHQISDDGDYKKYVKERLDDRWGDDCNHDSPCSGQQQVCGGVITVGFPFGISTPADTITHAILPFVKDLM